MPTITKLHFKHVCRVLGCLIILLESVQIHLVNAEQDQKPEPTVPSFYYSQVPGLQTRSIKSLISKNLFHTDINNTTKMARFLSSLFKSDAVNCAPQVMCELITAKEPGPSTDTINDYKYLIKEFFLKSDSSETEVDDDKKSNDKPSLFRSNASKQNKRKSQKTAKDGSSSEESVSMSSQEERTKGMAELMELEEEDELENRAIAGMISGDGDPDDFVFALADAKKKHKLQEMAANRLNSKRLQRNLDLLEKTLTGHNKKHTLRTSRALNMLIQRKARELKKTNDTMDRVRIAAEVGGITRSSRQCRALFDSCSMNNERIQSLVKGLRKQISGNPKQSDINMKDVTTLLREAQSWANAKSGTDVKVVLNIGGPPPLQEPSILPINTNNLHHPQFASWPQLIPSTTTAPAGISFIQTSTTTKPNKLSSIYNSHPSAWPKLIPQRPRPNTNASQINNIVIKKDTILWRNNNNNTTIRDEYRLKLQQASNIIQKIPLALSKNFTKSRNATLIKSRPNYKQDHLHKHMRKDSLESDSESNSWESSEEFENDDHLRNGLTSSSSTPKGLIGRSRVQRVLASVPYSNPHQNTLERQSVSWVSNIYDMFFRKASPLPENVKKEWVPSAQRHGSRPLQRHSFLPVYRYSLSKTPYPYHLLTHEHNLMKKLTDIQRDSHSTAIIKSQTTAQTSKVSQTVKKNKRKRTLKYRNCCFSK